MLDQTYSIGIPSRVYFVEDLFVVHRMKLDSVGTKLILISILTHITLLISNINENFYRYSVCVTKNSPKNGFVFCTFIAGINQHEHTRTHDS